MSIDKSKPSRRPFTKKKVQKSAPEVSPAEARRKALQSKAGKMSSAQKRSPRGISSVDRRAQRNTDFEPDARTRRAVSKEQYTSDRVMGFASAHARAIIVFAAIIISIWLMFPAVKGYYVSKRNLEVYTAVADYISTSNSEIEAKIESLNSEEGIKAHARERGLVEPGEISIVIQEPQKEEAAEEETSSWFNPFAPKDKPEEQQEDDEQAKQEAAKIASKGVEEKEKMKKIAESIRDEASPMQKFLDFIFGYKPPDIKVF